MNCKICGEVTKAIHKARILNKYEIQYFNCPACGFTQTENVYWLDEAYSDALSASDTGAMARNVLFARISKIILVLLRKKQGKFLDFGGGYGIFTRLMRDQGYDFYWYDKYAKNLLSRGFEGDMDHDNQYDMITSFENFEHFDSPRKEIEKILKLSDLILFSTELMPADLPSPEKWWYYCLEHGQHISIFSFKSLEYIAKQNDFNLISNGNGLHIFSKNALSPKIFLVTKIILKLGLDRFFNNQSKINSDMLAMIKKMDAS